MVVTRGAIQCGCTACVSSTRLNQSLKYSPRADCKSRLPANSPASMPARDDWRYPKLSHRARNHALQIWRFCLWPQIILPIAGFFLRFIPSEVLLAEFLRRRCGPCVPALKSCPNHRAWIFLANGKRLVHLKILTSLHPVTAKGALVRIVAIKGIS